MKQADNQPDPIAELRGKLTDQASTSPDLSKKLDTVSRNSALLRWLNDIPTIPDLFLDIISIADAHHFITEECLWELWEHACIEENDEYPDVTPVANLYAYASSPEHRNPNSQPPFSEISEIAAATIYPE